MFARGARRWAGCRCLDKQAEKEREAAGGGGGCGDGAGRRNENDKRRRRPKMPPSKLDKAANCSADLRGRGLARYIEAGAVMKASSPLYTIKFWTGTRCVGTVRVIAPGRVSP
eukprot:g16303.t1